MPDNQRRRLFFIALVGTILLAALFVSVLLREDTTIENSLVDMSILPPVPRRAILVNQGTRLEGVLQSRVLTRAESPYLLFGAVEVPAGVTMRAEPGVFVYAAEGASLTVAGVFTAEYASLISNQLHPLARLWHGITVREGGIVELVNTVVADASAALTCAGGGSLRVRGGTLQGNVAGVVTLQGSRSCSIEDVRIMDGHVGLHLVGGTPTITHATIDRVRDGLRVFHEAAPKVSELSIKRYTRTAIMYAARPDLVLPGLTLPPTDTPDTLILDGGDYPTHYWQGQKHPTGKVIIQEKASR